MRKIFWTSIFWFLIFALAGFYLKFMNFDLGQVVSDWIMTVDSTEREDGEKNPITQLLSGMENLKLQLEDGLSGLNMKLDETNAILNKSNETNTTSASSGVITSRLIKNKVSTGDNQKLE